MRLYESMKPELIQPVAVLAPATGNQPERVVSAGRILQGGKLATVIDASKRHDNLTTVMFEFTPEQIEQLKTNPRIVVASRLMGTLSPLIVHTVGDTDNYILVTIKPVPLELVGAIQARAVMSGRTWAIDSSEVFEVFSPHKPVIYVTGVTSTEGEYITRQEYDEMTRTRLI